MQKNNEALQAQMNKLEAENEYLKTCMDEQNSPSFVDKQGLNVQIERQQSAISSASKMRETFGIKPNHTIKSRKTTHMQPPTKQIQLNTRKTITSRVSASQTESELEDDCISLDKAMKQGKMSAL